LPRIRLLQPIGDALRRIFALGAGISHEHYLEDVPFSSTSLAIS
jgi:hypothetical protein